MVDVREEILARLVVICAAVPGITATARNRLDQNNLARPGIIVLDGIDNLLDAPQQPHRAQAQQLQRMELTPALTLLVRGNRDAGADAGSILSLYRTSVVAAVLGDATLADLVGASGRIRYEGAVVALPDAEGREYRMEITFVFTYTLRLGDLT